MTPADLSAFARLRAARDRASSPDERAVIAQQMIDLARSANTTTAVISATLDEMFTGADERARRTEQARQRRAEQERLLEEWGSEDAIFRDTPTERALRSACQPLLGPGETWGGSYRLAGWGGLGTARDMPERLRTAVSTAWPLPATVAAAWAEHQATEKLQAARRVFEPNQEPHHFERARRYVIEELLNALPAIDADDVLARLAWLRWDADQEVGQAVEEAKLVLATLTADIERLLAPVNDGRPALEVLPETGGRSRSPISGYGPGPAPVSLSSPDPASATTPHCAASHRANLRSPEPGSATPAPDLVRPIRRTNAEKREAVIALLGQGLSDREIGRRAGVSNQFAGNLRREVTSATTGSIP